LPLHFPVRAETPRSLIAAAAVVASFGFTLLGSTSAQAALVATGACDDAALSQPFASFGDSSSYKLISGGDFEGSLAGWSVSRGAAVVGGANGPGHALALSPGESIQTPSTCVNTSYPTFRLFAKNTQSLGTVLVQAVYKLPPLNLSVSLPVGVITLNGTWSPTLPMLTGSVAAGLLSNGTAKLSLRFTALTGTTAIDDIYVDPRMR
jgi:hypothetical protein